jgi:hypothetical protein
MNSANLIEIIVSVLGLLTGGGSLLTLRIVSARHDVELRHVSKQVDELKNEFRELKEEFLRKSGGVRQRD